MPAPRLPEPVRTAVADDIRAGGMGRNAIARKHGVSFAAVTKIAQDEGLTDAFDRSRTARATEDRRTDMRARRVEMAEQALDDADEIRARMFAPYTWVGSGRDGVETRELDQPDAAALRHLAASWAQLLDKHMRLDRHDVDVDGVVEARSLIREFMDAVEGSVENEAGGESGSADQDVP